MPENRIDTALNTQMLQEVFHHHENVKANREILRTLINATYFLAGQELLLKDMKSRCHLAIEVITLNFLNTQEAMIECY